MQDKVPNLHSLMWSVRCLHPVNNSHSLIVNSLVKQGMYTQSAEQLWKKITEHVADNKYSIKQTALGLDAFIKTFQIANPRLSKIITLDAVISHLVAIYSTAAGPTTKTSQSGDTSLQQKAGSNSSTGGNSSESTVSEFSLSSNSSDISVIIAPSGADEAKTPPEPGTTDDDSAKELMIKLLDALDIVRECIL